MTGPSCSHDGQRWFPGYTYSLCQACYEDAYRAWFERVTK